jgi:putative DNA primase/helicase
MMSANAAASAAQEAKERVRRGTHTSAARDAKERVRRVTHTTGQARSESSRQQSTADHLKAPGHEPRPSKQQPPEWQPPTPLPDERLRPVPSFEADLLPADLRAWVMDIADRMQVAPDLVAVAAMCALGVVAASARTVYPKRFDNWRVWTNLWGAAVAPAGSMKSPAAAAVERVLNKLEEQAREEFNRKQLDAKADVMIAEAKRKALKTKIERAAQGRPNAEAIDRGELLAALRQEAEDLDSRPRMRRVKATDTTIEALIDRAARGTRRCQPIAIWRDELVSLLSAFERDGHESDRKQLMEGWGVSTITVDRVARGTIFAKDFAVSIFGCVTPGAFGAYVREASADGSGADGFLQRLQLLVYPDQPAVWKHVDRGPDQIAEQRALEVYERLFSLDEDDDHGKPPALHFADDAQAFFDGWREALELRLRDPRQGWDDARRSHFSKYRSLMPAIAMLCHLASGDGSQNVPITFDAATRAAAWCAYLEAHAERVYAMRDRSIEEVLIDKIRRGKLPDGLTVRALQRDHLASYRATEIREALDELEEHGWLRMQVMKPAPGSGGGRPSVKIVLNPLARR